MRLQAVRDYVSEHISKITDTPIRYNQFAHANGVAVYSTLLALRRGLEPELAVTAALLHDIAFIQHGTYDGHAKRGADIAREFLTGLGSFNSDEINAICEAIKKHDDDPRTFTGYDAILSEADFMDNHLRFLKTPKSEAGAAKLNALLKELCINMHY
jgi:HD superfamily phosphodiesterase